MRRKVEVLVSPADDIQVLDGDVVLPGLAAHINPNPKKTDIWVTHITSGLPIVMDVHVDLLPAAVGLLARLAWNMPAHDIYESAAHRQCATEVKKMLRRSDRQESRLAKELGGRRSPASGAGIMKRDVRARRVLIEAKTTTRASYSIQLSELRLLTIQAFKEGRVPALVVQIREHEEVVLLPEYEIFELTGADPPEATDVEVSAMSISITESLVRSVTGGAPVRYVVNGEPYLLIGYELFITMAKPSP